MWMTGLLILISSCYAVQLSIGSQLAEIVKSSSAENLGTEMCILYDAGGGGPSSSWRNFLDDFLGVILTAKRFVLRRFAADGKIGRCEIYVIYLDYQITNSGINVIANELLRYGNRFSKFVFLSSVERVGGGEENLVRYYYSCLVHLLALTNTVHVTLGERDELFTVLYHDFLPNTYREVDVSEIEGILGQDRIRNVDGYPFRVLLAENNPFLFTEPCLDGFDYLLIKIFTNHINASWYHKIAEYRMDEKTLEHEFTNRIISMINVLRLVQLYTEQQISYFDSGLCIMLPEVLIGSIFNHLMRPFSDVSWIFLGVLLLICIVIGNVFQLAFPRGIFNQVFYGTLISDYEMKILERFTLFSTIFVVFLMSSAYEAKLFQLLFEKEYEPHLSTIQELIDRNYLVQVNYVYGASYLKPIFGNLLRKASDKHELSTDKYACVNGCSYSTAFINSQANVDPSTGKRKYYLLEERLKMFELAYTHSKLLPFRKKFVQIYHALFDMGVLNLWISWYFENVRYRALPTIDYLTFQDLVSLWKLVAYGQGLALVVFLLELVTMFKPFTKISTKGKEMMRKDIYKVIYKVIK